MKQWAFSRRSRAVTAKKCTKKRAARALLFCSTKLLLLWRSRHRGRSTMHLKLPYTCGSKLLHGGYCWKVIHFIVAISSFPERTTCNRGKLSRSDNVDEVFERFNKRARFPNCGETHKLDIAVEAEKNSFLLSSFLEHLTEPLLIFWSLSTLKMWKRSLLSWIWL